MRSFQDPVRTFGAMPPSLGVLLKAVDKGSGRQQLFEDQVPELLRRLARQTKVESITASNAIEGVEVEPARAESLASATPPRFRNRSEKEFAGYADALDGLMRDERLEPLTVPRLLELHRKMLAHTDDLGGYLKQEDNRIADRAPDGTTRTVFRPPSWRETEGLLSGLCSAYRYTLEGGAVHPLIALAAFVLDLLAIHPVPDGNGRLARLATTHELLRLDYGVARYVSVEQRIYESKNAYYTALEQSQRGWHGGGHSIWPWTEYLVRILADSYGDFENRVVAGRGAESGNKQERIRRWALREAPAEFKIGDVRRAIPGVSDPTIRLALRALRDEGLLEAESVGRGARWRRLQPDLPEP
ncbi:MAG TPA: Fic family protein [Solirubrobacterales bacterium]|nr:Fic family protein [Solirubrobacterales bacterium]